MLFIVIELQELKAVPFVAVFKNEIWSIDTKYHPSTNVTLSL
jgi:hypothetical protein